MSTKSVKHGSSSSASAEVVSVSRTAIIVMANGRQYFMSFAEFPWFKKGTLDAIYNLEQPAAHALHWPDLDIDIDLDYFDHPEKYPLKMHS